jgi:hypothetical protein
VVKGRIPTWTSAFGTRVREVERPRLAGCCRIVCTSGLDPNQSATTARFRVHKNGVLEIYPISELAISSVFVDELQWAMLKNAAFLVTTILWTLVANASGYEASEEIAKVLITVKPRQFEHVLREIERQGVAAKYSCRRYADDYEHLLTSVPQGTTLACQRMPYGGWHPVSGRN